MSDPIKVNSDDWTGNDPARAAPKGISTKTHERLRKFGFGLGCVALVMLGTQLVGFLQEPSWQTGGRLTVPAITALAGFGWYFDVWKKPSK